MDEQVKKDLRENPLCAFELLDRSAILADEFYQRICEHQLVYKLPKFRKLVYTAWWFLSEVHQQAGCLHAISDPQESKTPQENKRDDVEWDKIYESMIDNFNISNVLQDMTEEDIEEFYRDTKEGWEEDERERKELENENG